MDKTKVLFSVGLVLLAVGFGVGRYTVTPPDSQETSKNTSKENRNIEETITETKRPDGTIVKETKKIDKTIITETQKKEITIDARSKYKASALIGYNFDKIAPVYGAMIEKRILGNISAGLWANTDKAAGASISLEF